jgi:hypothetical protein
VSEYAILGLEAALLRRGAAGISAGGEASHVARVLSRLHLVRKIANHSLSAYIRVLTMPSDRHLFPWSYTHEIITYGFDCVPPLYSEWESFLRRHRVRVAFFSARQSAAAMSARIPSLSAHWIPEAVTPTDYSRGPRLSERPVHVLELGRRWDWYHTRISVALDAKGLRHYYEAKPGQVIFPSRSDLTNGLKDSMISICVPSSVSHPSRFGDVETVTHRYFESMASRCLLVGKCPSELVALFGYNPVVEIDTNDPATQLIDLVQNIDTFQDQVDKNYERLLEVGVWDDRASKIEAILEQYGYSMMTDLQSPTSITPT